MASPALRTIACLLVLGAPACVIRLSDRYAPIPNGGVTGGVADCRTEPATPRSSVGGDPQVKLVGRFDMRDPQNIRFDWSGGYITARFEGPQVSVRLDAPENDVIFSKSLDGGPRQEVHVYSPLAQPPGGQVPQAYLLYENLSPGPHEIVLNRDTEAQSGVTIFRGFDFGGGRLLPPRQRARRVEMIGDSITCGYGNHGKNATCPFDVLVRSTGECPAEGTVVKDLDKEYPTCVLVRVPRSEVQYDAYGSIVGRMLDADVVTTCWSGKGVNLNYRERTKNAEEQKKTMPTLWLERTIAGKNLVEEGGAPAWDFAAEPEPQVVVINLGTNDFTRDVLDNTSGAYDGDNGDNVPDGTIRNPAELDAYRQRFIQFVREVRERRKNAHIFVATPPMLTDQYPIDEARTMHRNVLLDIVAERQAAGDTRVYAMELVEQGTRYGLGCDYHPNTRVHEIMAEQVAGAIRSKTCWD